MKNIFKLMALFAFLFCFSSCEDDEPVIPTLEVTPPIWRVHGNLPNGTELLWMKVHTVM